MLQLFPDVTWIGAHMGGDPEHPDHLEGLLERYPNLHFDTSATKWQVREVSPRSEAIRGLIVRYPTVSCSVPIWSPALVYCASIM